MRVLILNQCYAPEEVSGAVLATELASDLAKGGHQVAVLTAAPNYPYGRVFRQGTEERHEPRAFLGKQREITVGEQVLARTLCSIVRGDAAGSVACAPWHPNPCKRNCR